MDNQTTETVLLENCVKQYQILLSAIKGYLQDMYKNGLGYYEVKHNIFTVINMINTAEELSKVYNVEK